PRCTSSKGLVVLDGVFAVLNGITAAALIGIENRTSDGDAMLAGSVIWTVIHTASGISGSRAADRCRAAQAEWDEGEIEEREHERRMRARQAAVPVVPADEPPPPRREQPEPRPAREEA